MPKCFNACGSCSTPLRSILRPSRPLLFPREFQRVQTRRRNYATAISAAELQFGQPVHETHPHLLEPGELTPGITALEYAQRRSKLAAKLPKNSIAILAASELKYRSGAVFYEYRQDSNFFYLTGFNEPEAVAIIGKSEHGEDHVFHLYCRPKDPKAELWEGPRSGLKAASDVFNADETGDVNRLNKLLPPILTSVSTIYTDIPFKPAPTSVLSRLFSTASDSHGLTKLLSSQKVKTLSSYVHELRAYKSDAELKLMRRIGRASGRSFTQTMRQKWDYERDIMNFVEYNFSRHGCDSSAYVPVVASGKNALSIHYTRNDGLLHDGDLVLLDAGGEHGHYITDMTRTFPVGPKYSPAQKDLYEAILSVQRSCVSLCHEDAGLSLDKLHDIAETKLKENLTDLGFDMSGKALDALFPHHLGHYVGLDVHDTPGFSRREPLKDRQVVTIEPGIHVPDNERWPAHFRGMGIQIEDCVAVGTNGPVVLTPEAPKEVIDIESLRAEQLELEAVKKL